MNPTPEMLPGPVAVTAVTVRQPYLPQTALEPQHGGGGGDSLTLADLLRIVLKHKWTLLIVVLVALTVAAVRTFLSTPIYRSTVVLQVERVAPRVVSFNNDMDQGQAYEDETLSLKTQYELLKSRALAERVVDELRLDQSKTDTVSSQPEAEPDATARGQELPGSYLERIVSGYKKLTKPTTRSAEALGRDGVIQSFIGALTVEPVRNSRLVKLHVANTNPELAAQIANATVQTYIAMGLERRAEAASYAKNFLVEQIKQIKARLEESERKLNQFAQAKQILTLDEKTSVVNQTYTDYATALSHAEQDRIKVEASLGEIRRNPESVAAVIDSKTIQSYKEQKAKLQIEYQQNLRIYKPDFPKMVQIRAQIAEVDAQIKAEVDAIAAGVQSQYEAAQKQESMIREKLGQTRRQVLSTQDSSIDLNLLKREVDTNRQLYDSLLQRLKQIGVSGGVVINNISVVDSAEPSFFPYEPNLSRNLMTGLAAGLFLGLCIVFVLEYLDDSIKFSDEVERVLGLPLMGVIPKMTAKRGDNTSLAMTVHTDPRSTLAEAYRSVRTALQFSTSEGAPKRLVITSTTRGEGKSTTALALAINFAQIGNRVLLIDADMRNPSLHKMLGMSNEFGLSNLLSSDVRDEKMILPSDIPNLSVLPAGPTPPNPVDLLMGPKLLLLLNVTAATLGFDYIIVDGPPMLGIADSVVLGNQLQDILFVVQSGSTHKSHIKSALRRLRLVGLLPRGVVLTQAVPTALSDHYGSYYGYGPAADTAGKSTRVSAAS